jgi:hypothetical protein
VIEFGTSFEARFPPICPEAKLLNPFEHCNPRALTVVSVTIAIIGAILHLLCNPTGVLILELRLIVKLDFPNCGIRIVFQINDTS